MNPWYLLYCKRREQQRAELHLERQGVNCYYPQVTVKKLHRGKLRLQREPLFPCYVFASFDFKKISFTTVRSTRGVVDFVRQGAMPVNVPLEIVTNVMIYEDSNKNKVSINDSVEDEIVECENEIDLLLGKIEGAEAIYHEPIGEKRTLLLIKLINENI